MNGPQHKIVGVGFGLAAAIAVSGNSSYVAPEIIIPIASIAGSLLPDIDHDRTKIGRKRRVVTSFISTATTTAIVLACVAISTVILYSVYQASAYGYNTFMLTLALIGVLLIAYVRHVIKNSKTFKWATKHRGFMHTLFPLIPMCILLGTFKSPSFYTLIFGVIVGYISHLFADMLTVGGCPILFPLTRYNLRILRLSTSKPGACTVAALTVACIVVGVSVWLKYFF